MPLYTFIDQNGGKFIEMVPMAELDQYLMDHPNLKQAVTAPMIVSGVDGKANKPDHGFCEILKGTQRFYKDAKINTWGR